jgi:hypothetical protein
LPRKPDDSVANVAESEASARFDRFRFMSFSQQDRWIVTKKLRHPVDGYGGVEEGGRVHGRSSANYRSLGAKISGEERHHPNYVAGGGTRPVIGSKAPMTPSRCRASVFQRSLNT